MASGKKSFVLYCDLIHTVDLLDDVLAGKLLKHLLRYVNDENPETDDPILKIAFEPIKRQLKRDLQDWEVIKKDRSNSGKLGNLKRWNKDLYEKVVSGEMDILEADNIAKNRKSSPSDKFIANVAVNVNDNVTVNDNVFISPKNKNDEKTTSKQFVNPKTQGQDLYAGKFREHANKEDKAGTKDN